MQVEDQPPEEGTPTAPKALSDKASKNFINDFLYGGFPEDEEEVTTTTPAPEEEVATTPAPEEEVTTTTPAPEEEVTTTPAPVTTTTPAPENRKDIDYDKIGESVAKALTKKDEPPAPEQPQPRLNEKQQRKLTHIKKLEELYPGQYKGLSNRFEAFANAEIDYKAQWEKDNPGETFDPEAPEHDRFYTKHEITYDKEEYLEAVAEVRADAKTKALREEFERQRREAEMKPKLQEMRKEVRKQVVKEFQEQIDLPVVGETISRQATYAEDVAETIHSLFNGADFDANNPIHANAERLTVMAEQAMLRQPATSLVDGNGRQFATLAEFMSMTPAQQGRHWTLSADHATQFAIGAIQAATKEQVSKQVESLEKYVAAKGGAAAPKVAPPAKPKSPASVSEPKLSSTPPVDEQSRESRRERAIGAFIG